MSIVVWFTMGLAIWHFTVFVPDRFWQGIVGALVGAGLGGIATGAVLHLAQGNSIGQTDIGTALAAVPGALAGIAIVYAIGVRQERALLEGL
jgi:outer membrane lipoprotein SlyB